MRQRRYRAKVRQQPSQQTPNRRETKADHVEVVALDALYERCRTLLNAVGARFVQGFAGGHIDRDFGFCQRAEPDSRRHRFHPSAKLAVAAVPDDGHARGNEVHGARQLGEHSLGVVGIRRLAIEHRAVQMTPVHDRVGTKHQRFRMVFQNCERFGQGNADGSLVRRKLGRVHFFSVAGDDVEGLDDPSEQIPSPRRGRCEDKMPA